MKKSQLRNIIRKSIKELMTEQAGVNNSHRTIGIDICKYYQLATGTYLTAGIAPNGSPTIGAGMSLNVEVSYVGSTMGNGTTIPATGWTCNGAMCNSRDVGKIFKLVNGFGDVVTFTLTYVLNAMYTPPPIGVPNGYNLTTSICQFPDPCVDPLWLSLPAGGTAGNPGYNGKKNNYCDRCDNPTGAVYATISGGTWTPTGASQSYPGSGINYCKCCTTIKKVTPRASDDIKMIEPDTEPDDEIKRMQELAKIKK